MAVRKTPEKIPLFVVPSAIGLFVVGTVIGWVLAGLFNLDRWPFLLRFSPLFTWAGTFVLALYLGRRQPSRPAAQDESKGFLWWDRAA